MAWKPEDIIGRASAGFDQADISEFAKLLMGNSMFRNASAGFEKANAGFDRPTSRHSPECWWVHQCSARQPLTSRKRAQDSIRPPPTSTRQMPEDGITHHVFASLFGICLVEVGGGLIESCARFLEVSGCLAEH